MRFNWKWKKGVNRPQRVLPEKPRAQYHSGGLRGEGEDTASARWPRVGSSSVKKGHPRGVAGMLAVCPAPSEKIYLRQLLSAFYSVQKGFPGPMPTLISVPHPSPPFLQGDASPCAPCAVQFVTPPYLCSVLLCTAPSWIPLCALGWAGLVGPALRVGGAHPPQQISAHPSQLSALTQPHMGQGQSEEELPSEAFPDWPEKKPQQLRILNPAPTLADWELPPPIVQIFLLCLGTLPGTPTVGCQMTNPPASRCPHQFPLGVSLPFLGLPGGLAHATRGLCPTLPRALCMTVLC